MKILALNNNNEFSGRYYFYLISIIFPQSAHAHGAEAVVYPLMLIALIQLFPAAHLIFRRAWNYSALYVFAIPFIWFFAWVIGMGLTMLGSVFSVIGAVIGVGIVLIFPFVFWRRILKWIDTES
jgi:hypothetical protein